MDKHEVITTDVEISSALERARLHDKEPRAESVEHIFDLNLLIVGLSNGRRLVLPVEDVQGLETATQAQLQNYELLGRGTGISFPDLDVDLYVPALIEGIYGNRRWMSELGKKGGAAKTEAKRIAAQANGTKGGRPKKNIKVRTKPYLEIAIFHMQRLRYDEIPLSHGPGVYAFSLREGAKLPEIDVDATKILYVGMTEASLNDRNHFFHAHSSFSSFRRSLGALLKQILQIQAKPRGTGDSDRDSDHFHFGTKGEKQLTMWMKENLEYSYEVVNQDIRERESELIRYLQPPLNLTQWPNHQKNRIMEMRKVCRHEADADREPAELHT